MLHDAGLVGDLSHLDADRLDGELVQVLNERLTARTVVAGLLILAGLAVSLARRRLPAEEVA